MGGLFSTGKREEQDVRIWPVRSFYHVEPGTDLNAVKYSLWDPKRYDGLFTYPNKEPAKDY